MTGVEKSEIYLICCYKICFVAIYALLRGEKLSQNLYRWRKNDKYEVCQQQAGILFLIHLHPTESRKIHQPQKFGQETEFLTSHKRGWAHLHCNDEYI